MKSVKNIVDECLELNIMSTKDYFRYIIKSNKLAGYFVTGKISAYYLAAIPNFRKIIDSLDLVSKAEFRRLYNRYDKYHSDINEVFLEMKNIKINPIKYTDSELFNKRCMLSK